MMTTTMIQAVTMMGPTKQTKTSTTRTTPKRTTTNPHWISTPALKTWMNRPNHYLVRWKAWRKRRKRKHPND